MNDIFIFLKETVFERFDRNNKFDVSIRGEIDESQNGLKDSELMFPLFNITD
ncbi:MAG: hypothetical protein KDD45_12525 [Bdellovibrionales bacterium]|nr:hypothetical protein [Bdellovibrionales bacterium]